MKSRYILIFSSLIFALLTITNTPDISAQCPPTSDGCGTWSAPTTINITLRVPDCVGLVTYRTRTCNGIPEVFIDSKTIFGTCTAMEVLQLYHYSYSALNDYIAMALVERAVIAGQFGTIPPCSLQVNGVKSAYVYSASCGVWVGCEYTADESSRICDPGYEAPYPDYTSGGNTKIKVYKWQSCGTTCCRRTIEFCEDVVDGVTVVRPKSKKKEKLAPCSDEGNYTPIPCQDGC